MCRADPLPREPLGLLIYYERLNVLHIQGGSYAAPDGRAIEVKNAICIHEEDAGVLWKHTDFRPGGRSRTVRSRRLVISMVCTVANYGQTCSYFPNPKKNKKKTLTEKIQSTSGTTVSIKMGISILRLASVVSFKYTSGTMANRIHMGQPWHPI